jgi:hypothetical protein
LGRYGLSEVSTKLQTSENRLSTEKETMNPYFDSVQLKSESIAANIK